MVAFPGVVTFASDPSFRARVSLVSSSGLALLKLYMCISSRCGTGSRRAVDRSTCTTRCSPPYFNLQLATSVVSASDHGGDMVMRCTMYLFFPSHKPPAFQGQHVNTVSGGPELATSLGRVFSFRSEHGPSSLQITARIAICAAHIAVLPPAAVARQPHALYRCSAAPTGSQALGSTGCKMRSQKHIPACRSSVCDTTISGSWTRNTHRFRALDSAAFYRGTYAV
jgi:hypothetical protein